MFIFWSVNYTSTLEKYFNWWATFYFKRFYYLSSLHKLVPIENIKKYLSFPARNFSILRSSRK